MDDYLEMLFKLGAIATIGKGKRSKKAIEACKKWKRVYFVTPSGTAAALSKRVKKSRVLAFEDLGPEAIYEIEVEDFPLIVAIDRSERYGCARDTQISEGKDKNCPSC